MFFEELIVMILYFEQPYYRYFLDSVKLGGGGGLVIFLVVSRASLYLHFVMMGVIQNFDDESKSQPHLPPPLTLK